MYKEMFIKSWEDLKNNPILFLPNIIILLTTILLGFLFLKYSGLLKLITDPELLAKGLETAVPTIKLFFKENTIKLIVSLTLFALTSFVIGSGLAAMKFGMMKELIKKRRLTLRKMWNYSKYTWQIISMKMIMFAIGIVTFLFLFGTGIILAAFLNKTTAIVIMGLFFPTFLAILNIILLFRYQAMFLEDRHPFMAVKASFEFFRKNKKYVFMIWLITTVVLLITLPVSSILGLTEQKLALISATLIIGQLIRKLISIIVNVWAEMFKFRSYKLKL